MKPSHVGGPALKVAAGDIASHPPAHPLARGDHHSSSSPLCTLQSVAVTLENALLADPAASK